MKTAMPTTPGHHSEVVRSLWPNPRTGYQFTADCACGWSGRERHTWSQAAKDEKRHHRRAAAQQGPRHALALMFRNDWPKLALVAAVALAAGMGAAAMGLGG